MVLLDVSLQIHSSEELPPTSGTTTLNMLSNVPVQVTSSEEFLPTSLTAVVLHVEVD